MTSNFFLSYNFNLPKDTIVAVADGSIMTMVSDLKANTPLYTTRIVSNNMYLAIDKISAPKLYKTEIPIYSILLDDQTALRLGDKCSILLKDGTYKRVEHIEKGDRLELFTHVVPKNVTDKTYKLENKRINIIFKNNQYFEDALMVEYKYKVEPRSVNSVIHKNGNLLDNSFDNLELDVMVNKTFTKEDLYNHVSNLVNTIKRVPIQREWRSYVTEHKLPRIEINRILNYEEKTTEGDFLRSVANKLGYISHGFSHGNMSNDYKNLLEEGWFDVYYENDKLYVVNTCCICGKKYKVKSYERKRHHTCGPECAQQYMKSRKVDRQNKKKFEENRLNRQLLGYSRLKKSIGRIPTEEEFIEYCGKQISPKMVSKVKDYKTFVKIAENQNHVVVSTEFYRLDDIWDFNISSNNIFVGCSREYKIDKNIRYFFNIRKEES